MKLDSGYIIKEMTTEEFFPQFSKIYDSLFGQDHTFFADSYYSPIEKEKLLRLKNRLGDIFSLHLGLFSPEGEFIGFSFGYQDGEDTFYMAASAVLPPHRGIGLYSAMVRIMIERCTEEGFQKIYGTHCATNNAVLVPKLKLGFIFSRVELSDTFGTVLHLQYFTNQLRRKVMDYRSGLRLPDSEIKSVMKFNRS